ncbi:MAG TPA: CehA/McbA family metallohydrolase, partial [Ohtaekwangia sp.]|nr:CehA/McbA family metallohydrolase [Ohtaekwangia sp.]
MQWMQAEDVHVGVLLKMGDFWAPYYDQYAWGEKGVYKNGDYLLTSGQEDPRTPEVGHAIGFGADQPVRYAQEYYYYDKVFDRLHELGGIAGYAHQAESFHGYRGLLLDGLRRKVDVLELLQFCVSQEPLQTRHYYHLLDLGYAVTAVAGSDFPWCGKDHDNGPANRNARIGNARFYSFLKGPLTFQAWKESVKTGHTFVTSGPMLQFTVNDKLPGDTAHLKPGESVTIKARAYGHPLEVPLEKIELVVHGKVIAATTAKEAGQSPSVITLETKIPIKQGCWIAVRAFAGPGQAAHTTPVYISVDGQGFQNPATISHYLHLAGQYLTELEKDLQNISGDPERQGWRYRKGIEARIAAARAVIETLQTKLRADRIPPE